MATFERPYFMENEEWFEDDEELGIMVLTDKATTKAIKSYQEFYIDVLDIELKNEKDGD